MRKTDTIRQILKDFEADAALWFSYAESCESGGQGYPSKINYEPQGSTNAKRDMYADIGVPSSLRSIHNKMMDMPEVHRKVFEQKLTKRYSDEERAFKLNVSKSQYHILVREAHSYVIGYHFGKLSDRYETRKDMMV